MKGDAPTIENHRRTSSPCPPLNKVGCPDPDPSSSQHRWLHRLPFSSSSNGPTTTMLTIRRMPRTHAAVRRSFMIVKVWQEASCGIFSLTRSKSSSYENQEKTMRKRCENECNSSSFISSSLPNASKMTIWRTRALNRQLAPWVCWRYGLRISCLIKSKNW